MDPNAEDIYNDSVRKLSPKERLRLAVMILNELLTDYERIEQSDSWTDQDLQDLSAFALSQEHRNEEESASS